MWIWLYRFAVLAAVLGIVAASVAYSERQSSKSEEWFRIEDNSRDIGYVNLGPHEVAFHIANVSNQYGRVVGLEEACTKNVCYKTKMSDPIVIAPGQSVEFICELMVSKPGPFEVSMVLYLDDNGIRQKNLNVKGQGVDPKGNPNAANKLP